jgi:signal transduction histidine kinase
MRDRSVNAAAETTSTVENLPTLFDAFVTHGKAGGTGLDLSITKAFVEAHGGSIEVRNVRDTGATFVVRLPQRKVRFSTPT